MAGYANGNEYMAQSPQICDSIMDLNARPHLWKYPQQYQCKSPTNNEVVPIDARIQLYKTNYLEWKTTAYHCQIMKQKVTTQVSFFSDVKTIDKQVEMIPISTEQCRRMARELTCEHGDLTGHDNIFSTANKVKYEYKWCCKPQEFDATNCIVTKTVVYKRFGKRMESPVAAIQRSCHYEDGSCKLEDGQGILFWDIEKQTDCRYIPWTLLDGKFSNGYFVSDDNTVALTFTGDKNIVKNTCNDTRLHISDQGIINSRVFDRSANKLHHHSR
jgi:hypothetical protein